MLWTKVGRTSENRVMMTGSVVPKSFPSGEYCSARAANYRHPMIFNLTYNKNIKQSFKVLTFYKIILLHICFEICYFLYLIFLSIFIDFDSDFVSKKECCQFDIWYCWDCIVFRYNYLFMLLIFIFF